MALKHGADGGVLASQFNSLSAAINALSSGENAGFEWKLTVDGAFTVSSPLTVPELITLDQDKGGQISFSGSGKITFLGIGLSRKTLESGEAFFAGCSITGRGAYNNGGTTNLVWQSATKYPRRIRTALIDSTDLCFQAEVLDRAIGARYLHILCQPTAVQQTSAKLSAKREIYFEGGEFANTSTQAAQWFLDSDSTVHASDRAIIRISSNATGTLGNVTGNMATCVFATQSFLRTAGGAYIYQEHDVIFRNLPIYGNGKVETHPTWGGVYNGTNPAIQLGNGRRNKALDNYIFFPQGYNISCGLGSLVNGDGLGGYFADEQIVRGNVLVGTQSQGVPVINGRRIQISENVCTEVAPYYNTNITIFDLEPNEPTDRLEDLLIEKNRIYAAAPGERNSNDGTTYGGRDAVFSGGVNKSRVFTGFHVQRSVAGSANRIAIVNNEIHGAFICQIGSKFHDSTNSHFEGNRFYDIYQQFSHTRQNYRLKHKGNTFSGDESGDAIVHSYSNFKSDFDDDFTYGFGYNDYNTGVRRYREYDRSLSKMKMSTTGVLSAMVDGGGNIITGDQILHAHFKGEKFVYNGSTYTFGDWIDSFTMQTSYSGAALNDITITILSRDNKYRSETMSKTLTATSGSRVYADTEITPGKPLGTNVAPLFTTLTGSTPENGTDDRALAQLTNGFDNNNAGRFYASLATPTTDTPVIITMTAATAQEIKAINLWGLNAAQRSEISEAANTAVYGIKNCKIWSDTNGDGVLVERATVTNNTLIKKTIGVNLFTAKIEFRITESISGGNVRVGEIELYDKAGTW